MINLVDFFWWQWQVKRRTRLMSGEELPNLGEINGKVDTTLRAVEAREAVGDVEYGFAVSAW